MKYEVSKKGLSNTFKFATYEEAVGFCEDMVLFGNYDAEELMISEIK